MRISTVVTNVENSVRELIRALLNNLKASDNFAPDGQVGQVLTSNGPNSVPSWKDPAVTAAMLTELTARVEALENP